MYSHSPLAVVTLLLMHLEPSSDRCEAAVWNNCRKIELAPRTKMYYYLAFSLPRKLATGSDGSGVSFFLDVAEKL